MVVRLAGMGGMGGYYLVGSFWERCFPANVLHIIYAYFFPISFGLAGETFGSATLAILVAMLAALGALFILCVRASVWIPGKRLALYLAIALILAIPVWRLMITRDFEGERFAYLPTIGFIWLCGELGAQAWQRRGRGRWVSVGAMVASLVLCLWQLTPWRLAQREARSAIQAAVRVVQAAPKTELPATFYFQSLPDGLLGAQVCRNGFALAVTKAIGRPVLVQAVGADIPEQALRVSTRQPGEYVYQWQGKQKTMVLVRDGSRGAVGGAP